MKRRAVLSLGLATAAVLAGLLYWAATRRDHTPGVCLPDADDVEVITAEINDHTDNMGIRPVPAFPVPREHFPLLLSVLTPAERNDRLRQAADVYPVLGHLKVLTKRGEAIRIDYYWAGQNPLVFAVDGVLCQRGGEYMPGVLPDSEVMGIDESLLLYHVVYAIYSEGVKGHRTGRLDELRKQVERSTGRAPMQPTK